jgi:hypothetical protein
VKPSSGKACRAANARNSVVESKNPCAFQPLTSDFASNASEMQSLTAYTSRTCAGPKPAGAW